MSWEGRGVKVDWAHVGGGTMPETIQIDPGDVPAWERPAAPAANAPQRPVEYPDRINEPRAETPEERRAKTIADLDSELEAAALALTEALAWCRSINYHTEATELLDAAAELVSRAQGLIDAFEVRA